MGIPAPELVEHLDDAAFGGEGVIELLGEVAADQRAAAVKVLAGVPLVDAEGLAAVDIAAERGARVIAVSRSQRKLDLARELGADEVVNYAEDDWTPANLESLKTENFSYTVAADLNKSLESIRLPFLKGFTRVRSAHLIGVAGAPHPWEWERRLARAENIEAVVLWAFDQFSMVGYRLPLGEGSRRSRFVA